MWLYLIVGMILGFAIGKIDAFRNIAKFRARLSAAKREEFDSFLRSTRKFCL
jgi:hypothetical protein